MRKVFFSVLVLVIPLLFSSCATILCGTKQKITVKSDVEMPAYIYADGRSYNVNLPATVKIKRKPETSKIVVLADGYKLESAEFDKQLNGIVLGNVIAPNFAFIDWITGANKKTNKREIKLSFTKVENQREHSNTYCDYAMEYYKMDNLDAAMVYLEKALEIDTENERVNRDIELVDDRYFYLEALKLEQKASRAQRWGAFFDVLLVTLDATTQVAANVQALSGNDSSSSYGSSSSGQSGSGCNCAALQDAYNRHKRNAGSNASTYGHSKGQEQAGAITAGRYGDNSGSNANLKMQSGKNMRAHTQETERIERQARKCGCNLRY